MFCHASGKGEGVQRCRVRTPTRGGGEERRGTCFVRRGRRRGRKRGTRCFAGRLRRGTGRKGHALFYQARDEPFCNAIPDPTTATDPYATPITLYGVLASRKKISYSAPGTTSLSPPAPPAARSPAPALSSGPDPSVLSRSGDRFWGYNSDRGRGESHEDEAG